MTTFPYSYNKDTDADLSSHEAFVRGVPYATFARLRRDDPIHWTPESDGGRGFWSVTRFHDVGRLNNNFRLMSSAQGIRIEDQSEEEYHARKTFQETDPPEHRKVRHALNPFFSEATMAQFEQDIRTLSAEILDEACATPELEGVSTIARRLPMLMLARILGIPNEDAPILVEMGDQLIANSDPEFTDFVIDQADTDEYRLLPFRSPAAVKLYDYAKSCYQRIQEGTYPYDGVMRRLIGGMHTEDYAGHRMSEDEFRNFFCLLVAAGNDTTRYSIAAMLQYLANSPELLRELQAGLTDLNAPAWTKAADEIIRNASPTMHFRRTVTKDFQYNTHDFHEGDKVVLWFVAANHDETYFPNPHKVDLANPKTRHVAFGQGGPHVCLGMYLARLEVRVLLQELLMRVARIEQTGEQQFLRSNFIGGIKHLPLRITLK